MARLNEDQPGAHSDDALEALKQRYVQQNREITRANSAQSVQISGLRKEQARLQAENSMLQLQVNHLEVELARRDKEREIIEHNQVTQRKLESKVADLMLLLKEINKPSTGSPCKHSNLSDADDSPFLEPRLMRSYNSDEETEGYLPCIEEETQSRKLGSGGDRRKSSFNFAGIELPPPSPEIYVAEHNSDNEEPPPPMNNVAPRTRRRRDSFIIRPADTLPEPVPEPVKLSPEPVLTPTIFSPEPETTPTPAAVSKPPKRKFADKESDISPAPELDFRFSKVSAKAAKTAKLQMDVENIRSSRNNEEEAGIRMEETEDVGAMPKPSKSKRLSTSEGLGSIVARKALGPKSTNVDPVNSPSKVAQKEAPEYYSEKEKVSEKLQPTTTRSYRRNITRDKDTPPPETNDSAAAATSRTARRTRPTVSYAEPSLRDKMRREETGFVDAVKGEGKMRRGSRKKAGKEDRELPISDIKNEDLDIVGPTTVHWMDLPPLKSAIHLEEADADRAKNPKTEVVVMMDGENHPLLPASIITSRKRRISSLVASLPGTESEPGDLKRKAEPTDEQRGRNSRRSMNRPRSRSPEVEMENVGRGMRRSSLDSGTSPGDDRAGRRRRMMI